MNKMEIIKHFDWPLNIYAQSVLLNTDKLNSLHLGMFPDHLKFYDSQEYFTDFLIQEYMTNPCKILEIGSGLGKTGRKLIEKGFDYTGICPDKNQIEYAKIYNQLTSTMAKFEDYETKEKFDFILFQESSQYIEMKTWISKSHFLLKEGGVVLVIDEIMNNKIKELINLAKNEGFEIKEIRPITEIVYKTFNHLLEYMKEKKSFISTKEKCDLAISMIEDHIIAYKENRISYCIIKLQKVKIDA